MSAVINNVAALPSIHNPLYYGNDPVLYNGYVFGMEKVRNMAPEVLKLWESHWQETEVLYLDSPLIPDIDMLIQYEKSNSFVVFTVRVQDTTEMVGELMYFLGPNSHIKGTVIANEDAFYLRPDHRSGRIAIKLLKYAEEMLSVMGVNYVGMSDKSPAGGKNLGPLMRRCGYKQVAIHYAKQLSEDIQDI